MSRAMLLLVAFFTSLIVSCASSDGGSTTAQAPAPIVWDLFLVSGAERFEGDLPAPLSDGSAPEITLVSYPRVIRQGGHLKLSVYFVDTLPIDVNKLLIQIIGANEHYSCDVKPILDPISGNWLVNVELVLSESFEPGPHGFLVTLTDAAGNVADYFGKAFWVKTLSEINLTTLVPQDEENNVSLNASVWAGFNVPLYDGDVAIELSDENGATLGETRLTANGNYAFFLPGNFLNADTNYSVRIILYNQLEFLSSFHTEVPSPLLNPLDLVGKVFVAPLADGLLLEPEEAQAFFGELGASLIVLLMVTNVDPFLGTIEMMGALGESAGSTYQQNLTVGLFQASSPTPFFNPYFLTGPADIILDLVSIGMPGNIGLYDILISGKFSEDGISFSNGIYSGFLNPSEVNAVLKEVIGLDLDVCKLAQACDQNGRLPLRAVNINGFFYPDIPHLYDLTISADLQSLPPTGGTITIAGRVVRDGIGWGPSTEIRMESNAGTWDKAGGIYFADGTGNFIAVLNVANGEVPSGSKISITASLTLAEAAGRTISRKITITVQ